MNMTFNSSGYVPLVNSPDADVPLPVELILGSSSDDVPDIIHRRHRREEQVNVAILSRTSMLRKAMESNMDRPSKRPRL